MILDAVTFLESVHCCSVQVLSLHRGGGRCLTIQTLRKAVHSAKGCSTATTVALTSIKQKIQKGEVSTWIDCILVFR